MQLNYCSVFLIEKVSALIERVQTYLIPKPERARESVTETEILKIGRESKKQKDRQELSRRKRGRDNSSNLFLKLDICFSESHQHVFPIETKPQQQARSE